MECSSIQRAEWVDKQSNCLSSQLATLERTGVCRWRTGLATKGLLPCSNYRDLLSVHSHYGQHAPNHQGGFPGVGGAISGARLG